jgi:hypothetical protein
MRRRSLLALCLPLALVAQSDMLQPLAGKLTAERLMATVRELCSEKYQGRLTGTPEYEACAAWCTAQFQAWGIQPGAPDGSFRHSFPDPYTLVKGGGSLTLTLPIGTDTVQKTYRYQTEYFPGGTSDGGTVTAQAVYAGFGITAPELGYDDYAGLDVRGKIVVIEPEAPATPSGEASWKLWRPHSFHDVKTANAVAHGAAALVYNFPIANPNNVWRRGLLTAAVGPAVMADLFTGTGKKHPEVVKGIRTSLKPASMPFGKTLTLKAVTEHHPEGIGTSVVGRLGGTDPKLKDEVILIAAHLDHLGLQPEMMPGANDNASADAVLMALAEALGTGKVPLKRTVMFALLGAEEQGVKGSETLLKAMPGRIKTCLNLESVGRGERITVEYGRNFPELMAVIERANAATVKRELRPSLSMSYARPRTDATHFFWAGIPTLNFGASGGAPLGLSTYHTTYDTADRLTPKIMEDLAKILLPAVVELANR